MVVETIEGLTHRLLCECRSEKMLLGKETVQENGDSTFELDCSTEEATFLFKKGLQLLVGEAFSVLDIHKFKSYPCSSKKSVEIGDDLYEYCINIGFIDILKNHIKEIKNGCKE